MPSAVTFCLFFVSIILGDLILSDVFVNSSMTTLMEELVLYICQLFCIYNWIILAGHWTPGTFCNPNRLWWTLIVIEIYLCLNESAFYKAFWSLLQYQSILFCTTRWELWPKCLCSTFFPCSFESCLKLFEISFTRQSRKPLWFF